MPGVKRIHGSLKYGNPAAEGIIAAVEKENFDQQAL